MSRVGMFPAKFEAVTHRFKANGMTSGTLLDALPHLGGDVGCGLLCHGNLHFV
jgi:hypothetical protein